MPATKLPWKKWGTNNLPPAIITALLFLTALAMSIRLWPMSDGHQTEFLCFLFSSALLGPAMILVVTRCPPGGGLSYWAADFLAGGVIAFESGLIYILPTVFTDALLIFGAIVVLWLGIAQFREDLRERRHL